MTGDPLTAPIFVVGPPRSGTTLLRVMLCRHPNAWILTETHLLDRWVREFPGLQDGDPSSFREYWRTFTATEPFTWLGLDADAVADRVAESGNHGIRGVLGAMLAEAAAVHGVARVGEKTPDHARHVADLLAAFPQARVLWLVRDPIATVESELALDRAWASDDPVVAARRWAATTAPLDRWRQDPRVLVVRFEELVDDPERTLRGVCAHLDLAFDPVVLADEGGNQQYVHGRRDPWGRLDPRAGSRSGTSLDVTAIERVDAVVADLADRLGYPRPRATVHGVRRVAFEARRAARRTVVALRHQKGRA